jgi:uncharacterized protein Yka (UPF0111/DUF47 family)
MKKTKLKGLVDARKLLEKASVQLEKAMEAVEDCREQIEDTNTLEYWKDQLPRDAYEDVIEDLAEFYYDTIEAIEDINDDLIVKAGSSLDMLEKEGLS